jgi:probable HAF family extracellular repeat protein
MTVFIFIQTRLECTHMKTIRSRYRFAPMVALIVMCAALAHSAHAIPPLYHVTDLGDLSGGGLNNFAYDVNNSGQVVGISLVAAGLIHPFIWADGVMQDLRPTGGDAFAYGINESGQVVGKAGLPGGGACLWTNGTLQDLGDLPTGANASEAYGINDDGQVVGVGQVATESGERSRAFLWSGDKGMQDIGFLWDVVPSSGAFAINNAGQVVGSSSVAPAGEGG